MNEQIKVGDRVCRKKATDIWVCNTRTVESINEYNKTSVLWDEKAGNGQQHSTLDIKVLKSLNSLPQSVIKED